MGLGLSLQNNISVEDGNEGKLFKVFFGHAVMDSLDLVTEPVVQVGQLYASHCAVLAVSLGGYVSNVFVTCFAAIR